MSLARSLFGLSLSRKIPTELCEHSHAKWRRPEGQNATNIFRLRGGKKDECILKYIFYFSSLWTLSWWLCLWFWFKGEQCKSLFSVLITGFVDTAPPRVETYSQRSPSHWLFLKFWNTITSKGKYKDTEIHGVQTKLSQQYLQVSQIFQGWFSVRRHNEGFAKRPHSPWNTPELFG